MKKAQKSFYATPATIQQSWFVVDASDKILGRLVSYIAGLVRGKYDVTYTPSMDLENIIVVVNADKIKVTGNKLKDKTYYWHTGYPGGIKSISLKDQLNKDASQVIYHALKGMLPRNRMGRNLLKRVKIYSGAQHPHEAQNPQVVEIPAKEM
jgi:large subunit ribosomal protein L13